MQVIIFLDKNHNTLEVKDRILSVLPDAKYMIFDTNKTPYIFYNGEWLPDYETFTDCNGYESEPIQTGWVCSLCGNYVSSQTPYCSQCGAKMKMEGINNGTL